MNQDGVSTPLTCCRGTWLALATQLTPAAALSPAGVSPSPASLDHPGCPVILSTSRRDLLLPAGGDPEENRGLVLGPACPGPTSESAVAPPGRPGWQLGQPSASWKHRTGKGLSCPHKRPLALALRGGWRHPRASRPGGQELPITVLKIELTYHAQSGTQNLGPSLGFCTRHPVPETRGPLPLQTPLLTLAARLSGNCIQRLSKGAMLPSTGQRTKSPTAVATTTEI